MANLAIGLLAAGGFFFLLALLTRGAMGLGDVKLAAATGALVGWPAMVAALLLGILAGGVAALLLLLTRRAGRKDYFAYGPYLASGAWVVYCAFLGLWG
jgi:prepilin signal peptidase PulO-like enzyme (type II secretory pathway)